MKAFDDFIKRKLIESFTDIFTNKTAVQEGNASKPVWTDNQSLAIWLSQTVADNLLC